VSGLRLNWRLDFSLCAIVSSFSILTLSPFFNGLKVLHDIPIWAYVFFLFRAGRADVALEFVGRNEALFKTEPQFVYFLQEYLADPNHM
jgi:hypothetical protein